MEHYPATATERFDDANFHINYCLSIIKKYKRRYNRNRGRMWHFTKNYVKSHLNVVLTEKDQKNIYELKEKFKR